MRLSSWEQAGFFPGAENILLYRKKTSHKLCSGTASCRSWERRNWDQTQCLTNRLGLFPVRKTSFTGQRWDTFVLRNANCKSWERRNGGQTLILRTGWVPDAENVLPSFTGKQWVTNRAREPHNFFELLFWAIAGRSDNLKLLLLVGNLVFNSCGFLPIWKQCTGILTGAFLPPSGHREDFIRFDFARQEEARPLSPPQQLLVPKARNPEQCLRSYLSDSCSSGTLYQSKSGTQESPAEARGINRNV